MKIIATSILVLGLLSAGAFARAPDCNPAVGNWVNASPITCRIQGSGSGGDHPVAKSDPVPVPCPHEYPKDKQA